MRMKVRWICRFWLVLATLWSAAATAAPPAPEDIEYVGRYEWPGTATDKSEKTGRLEDGSSSNRLGGFGSGVVWTGQRDLYAFVSDRGAGDGAVSYQCRFHRASIQVRPGQKPAVVAEILGTYLLTGPEGRPLVGAAKALGGSPDSPVRFDPEAIRSSNTGTFFIAEEYGPSVWEFDRLGRFQRAFTIPERLAIAHPAANAKEELPPRNTRGRVANRGLEGLAFTPDGQKLHALMQGPLIQDGALDAEGKRAGRNVRWIVLDVATGRTTAEYVYPLEMPSLGLSEVEAITWDTFLVIERDGAGGLDAKRKRIYRVDISKATDVSDRETLPAEGLPDGVTPVRVEPFLDLLDPRWGIAGADCPEKVEGIALGPTLPDGRRVLVVSIDNDFLPNVPSRIEVFLVRLRS